MSAKSGRSNIKPIFNFLPHVAENFVILFFSPQALLIRDLHSCSVAGCGGTQVLSFKKHHRGNISVPNPAISEIERLSQLESHFTALTNVTMPSGQKVQLASISRQILTC
jgi:hypothetical protein